MPTIEKKTLLAIINPISGTTKKEYVPELSIIIVLIDSN